MDKLIAKILMVMVYTGLVAMLVFGAYNKYYVEKISWSNYNGNWEEVTK